MAVRLNIGCGQTPTEGWINYDNSLAVRLAGAPPFAWALGLFGLLDAGNREFAAFARRRNIRWADATRRIPHADGAVDVVYSSHMIEHLDRRQARGFLAECRRVLKSGGLLRLAVPDLCLPVREYLADGNADLFLEQLQFDLDRPHGFGERLRHFLSGGGRNHHWMYDERSIARLVAAAGFDDVRTLPAGSSRIADAGDLDLAERSEESIYLEATRP
ncbi:MAG: methyltransferase domain-containing protein [Enhydrobacter sp.]|nr:MAG: methyltransferase domain-containing protein [Enhydrobacter sp.]